jgi:hypothetical protein
VPSAGGGSFPVREEDVRFPSARQVHSPV